MSAGKCARCDKTVYPVEGLRCLDKIWHKGCFKCHECNMTLNMKNYKGFEKRPYCNAHCPQAKATTVADTPEIRRLAENTRIQSQAKYHEDFEKSKGKGFTTVLDDPEMRRIKETSKIISNVAYHGDLERKKQMEEKRGVNGHDEGVLMNNNNSINSNNNNNNNNNNINVKHQNKTQSNSSKSNVNEHISPSHQQAQQYQQQQQRLLMQQQQQQHHQQQQHQQQQYMQKQQMLMKQQQQQQYNVQNRQSAEILQHQQASYQAQRGAPHPHQMINHPTQLQHQHHHQQQQQMIMRQQQQQIIMQQQRQSMDPSIPMGLHNASKQAIMANNHPIGKHPNMMQAQNQPPIKYMPMNDVIPGQHIPPHLVGMQPHLMGPMQQQQHPQQGNRRPMTNAQPSVVAAQGRLSYGPNGVDQVEGLVTKQSMLHMPLPQQIVTHLDHQVQMRPASYAGQPIHQQMPNQVPRRVFRAMYDYVANDVDEVSFFENDILVDCVNVDRNWLIGKVARSGQTGMLPANYVAELPSQ